MAAGPAAEAAAGAVAWEEEGCWAGDGPGAAGKCAKKIPLLILDQFQG